jgi:hypothetical protein
MIFSSFDRHVFRGICGELVKRYTLTRGSDAGKSLITKDILSDELPPFNVTITFTNEYGNSSIMSIYGIHIQDEGQIMSINDVMTENTMSYFAADISLMDRLSVKPSNQNGYSPSAEDGALTINNYWISGQVTNTIGGLIADTSKYRLRVMLPDGSFTDVALPASGNYFVGKLSAIPVEVILMKSGVRVGSCSKTYSSTNWNIKEVAS